MSTTGAPEGRRIAVVPTPEDFRRTVHRIARRFDSSYAAKFTRGGHLARSEPVPVCLSHLWASFRDEFLFQVVLFVPDGISIKDSDRLVPEFLVEVGGLETMCF